MSSLWTKYFYSKSSTGYTTINSRGMIIEFKPSKGIFLLKRNKQDELIYGPLARSVAVAYQFVEDTFHFISGDKVFAFETVSRNILQLGTINKHVNENCLIFVNPKKKKFTVINTTQLNHYLDVEGKLVDCSLEKFKVSPFGITVNNVLYTTCKFLTYDKGLCPTHFMKISEIL